MAVGCLVCPTTGFPVLPCPTRDSFRRAEGEKTKHFFIFPVFGEPPSGLSGFRGNLKPEAISYPVGIGQSKTALFDWSFFPLDYSAPSIGGWCEGILPFGRRRSVGRSLLRAFFASNACLARDEPSSKRIGGLGLRRKPAKLRSWRCTQPRAAKATAGVAVVGNMTSITRAAAVV